MVFDEVGGDANRALMVLISSVSSLYAWLCGETRQGRKKQPPFLRFIIMNCFGGGGNAAHVFKQFIEGGVALGWCLGFLITKFIARSLRYFRYVN